MQTATDSTYYQTAGYLRSYRSLHIFAHANQPNIRL
jgi:hypothetical protein